MLYDGIDDGSYGMFVWVECTKYVVLTRALTMGN